MASDYVFAPMSAATGGAGPYVNSSWRIVLHTTETNSRPSAWIPNFQYPSHIVCSYEHQEIWQLIGFNEAGKALYHAPGDVETNRMGAIQIEINGIADEAGSWSEAKLKWLGEAVLKPICDWIDANGGGFDCFNIPVPGPHSGSASANAPQRMTSQEWVNFNGICGHRHVPQNDHYDPDQLNVPQIVAYANQTESDDMTPEQEANINGKFQVLFDTLGAFGWHLNTFPVQAGREGETIAARVGRLAAVVERFNTDTYGQSTGTDPKNPNNNRNFYDEVRKGYKLDEASIETLTKSVVSALNANGAGSTTPVDYDKVASIVRAELAKLTLHAS